MDGSKHTTSRFKKDPLFVPAKVGHGPVGNSLIENLLEQRERNVSITVLCHGEGLGGLNFTKDWWKRDGISWRVERLQETNISHLGKRKIIFKHALSEGYVSSLEGTLHTTNIIPYQAPLRKADVRELSQILWYGFVPWRVALLPNNKWRRVFKHL